MNASRNPFTLWRRSRLVRLCAPVLIGVALAASRSAADVDTVPILKHDLQAAVNTQCRSPRCVHDFRPLPPQIGSEELRRWPWPDWRAVRLSATTRTCEEALRSRDRGRRRGAALEPEAGGSLGRQCGSRACRYRQERRGDDAGPQMATEMGQGGSLRQPPFI